MMYFFRAIRIISEFSDVLGEKMASLCLFGTFWNLFWHESSWLPTASLRPRFCCYLQAFMMCVVEILKLGMPTIPPAFQLTSSKLWKTWRHSKFQSEGILFANSFFSFFFVRRSLTLRHISTTFFFQFFSGPDSFSTSLCNSYRHRPCFYSIMFLQNIWSLAGIFYSMSAHFSPRVFPQALVIPP